MRLLFQKYTVQEVNLIRLLFKESTVQGVYCSMSLLFKGSTVQAAYCSRGLLFKEYTVHVITIIGTFNLHKNMKILKIK